MSKPWYRTARWKQLRARHLQHEPLCRYCKAAGYVVEATVADHIIPHKGDSYLFWHGELQSLCASHHSGTKQAEEAGRPLRQIGLDGYAVDGPRDQGRQPPP